jgi:hypothetical protein
MLKCKLQLLCIYLTIITLTSCATSSPIARFSGREPYFRSAPRLMNHNFPASDIYTLYQRAASGFESIESIRSQVERRAEIFANRQNKSIVVLGENISEPPYILGNFPRIQIVFALIDKQ